MVHGSRISPYNRLVTVMVAFGSMVGVPLSVSFKVLSLTHLKTYGYCASIIGSTIGQPGWYSYFNLPVVGQPGYATTTTNAIATANGLFSAGGAVGSLFIMWSASAIGRKRNIQLGAVLSVVGGVLQGGAAALAYVNGAFV